MLAVTALSTALLLTACSGDDGDGGDDAPGGADSPSAGQSEDAGEPGSGEAVPAQGCRTQVDITGAAEVSWKSKGYNQDVDGATIYRSSNNKNGWLFLTVEDGKATEMAVRVRGTDYPAKPKDVRLETSDTGVDASATIKVDEGSVDVEASFVCAAP